MDIHHLLNLMLHQQASDLFITLDAAPSMKINGKMQAVAEQILNLEQVTALVDSVMDQQQREHFKQEHECNFAISNAEKTARFRVSALVQRDAPAMVIRRIESQIPNIEQLNLPPILKELSMSKRGIILLVGGTGSGKSTTLAAMLGHRNQHSQGHIITIEDPIEFIHPHLGCIVTQREVGMDTASFEVALKNTLRQAPDVILIGEIRSREIMDYALAFAETGHLVLATLHANNANQTLDRIVHFFDSDRHAHTYMALSLNLKAVIAQQLIPAANGDGRCAAIEIMINSPLISELIRKGEVEQIKGVIQRSSQLGMQSFDQDLFDLYQQQKISYEHALLHADTPNDLRLKIKLAHSSTQ